MLQLASRGEEPAVIDTYSWRQPGGSLQDIV